MTTRLVRGADGRMWTLRGQLEWSQPATIDDFEHDVASGYTPGIVMLVMLGVLVVALVAWRPTGVVVPLWLVAVLVLVLVFFPLRWALRRPWRLVANTPGSQQEQVAERWVGTVRGMFNVRTAAAKVARDIEVYSMPNVEGPLHPVD
ncbi:MAG TPA: DUF983 domain-containing protein [Pseudonocardiaceae bacterium]|jgi:hypothetical protein|nr:DUF983 domain-containing protein [Pseudonocardiaceae bacterium]